MSKTFEQQLAEKDEREAKQDPLAKLNKARTKRLEEAYFAQLQDEEEEYQNSIMEEYFEDQWYPIN